MKDEKWGEQEIEKLLSQAPKIQDNRSKEDVFAKLKEAGAFEEEVPVQKVIKKKRSLFSIYGLTAALLLFAFGGMYYISGNKSQDDVASTSMENADMATKEAEGEMTSGSPMMIRNFVLEDMRTAVYPEQLESSKAFYIGLAGDDAESVPVTIIIPNEQLIEDFGTDSPSQVEMYQKYAALIDEQAAGFRDYHPVKGIVEEQGLTVVHTLPQNHDYDTASGTMSMYIGMLVDTFGKSYDTVEIVNEEGSAMTFSEVGEPSEPLLLTEKKRYSYFIDEQSGGIYLSPNFRQTFDTATEALQFMKTENNDIYQSAILPGVDYTVTEEDIVTVTFTQPLDLEAFDPQQAMYMVEAMLLTASSFDKQVRFENVIQAEWQEFNFTQVLPMPVGANQLSIEFLQR
ncbi:hypothetical protein AAGS61_02300 [Lysinibacillus sp. KU-BSD001]|uniref:hypothetical protein n=1 Tax=Lysinibacillus sp. KU-BSD001 TaxID=3141328 RepID=UPI0036F17CC4